MNALFKKTLLYHLWHEFWLRYYFKFVLPRVREIELDGLQLDVSGLPPKSRNRVMSGAYESHERRMCLDFLDSSDSVLEIGGAIGFIGLVCQKKIGIRRYGIVEANPRTLEMLKRNYRMNGLAAEAWNFALADHDGQVELEVEGDFWENSILERSSSVNGRTTMTVPAATLDTLLKLMPHSVNVLIIDVEGAEQFIDANAVPDNVNKIIIELHPALLGAEKTYRLISDLIVRGFHVAREEAGTFTFLKPAEVASPDLAEYWTEGPALPLVRRQVAEFGPQWGAEPQAPGVPVHFGNGAGLGKRTRRG